MYIIVTNVQLSGKYMKKIGKHNLMIDMQAMNVTNYFEINNNY